MIQLKGNRELLWDTDGLESCTGIRRTLHAPIKRNEIFQCSEPWEDKHCGYCSVHKVDGEYYFYYRARVNAFNKEGKGVWCLARSKDGKNFEKTRIRLHEYGGNFENNIVVCEPREIDNFSPFYDTNPNCREDERFKAVSLISAEAAGEPERLAYYTSPDGITFTFRYFLDIDGMFDSYNVLFCDESIGMYRLYFRSLHFTDGSDARESAIKGIFDKPVIRDVRLAVSKDLVHWETLGKLDYGDEDLIQTYTNQIMKYPRADVYIGFPVRYIDRRNDMQNFKHLSDKDGWRSEYLSEGSRSGSAITDCVIMYSRDGKHFKRDDNAFLSAGYEQGNCWIYGDFYLSYGLCETESDDTPGVTEYSFYSPEGYRTNPVSFVRYTIRLDGFYSLRADYSGGEFVTKPMTLGDSLSINFKTSALGDIRIIILDEHGEPIDGYDSGYLFGNSTNRPVAFAKPLSELAGKPVKLKFIMKDADIYSICSDL